MKEDKISCNKIILENFMQPIWTCSNDGYCTTQNKIQFLYVKILPPINYYQSTFIQYIIFGCGDEISHNQAQQTLL